MNINIIRNLAKTKKEQLKKNGDDLRKINNILNLLKDDMCFFKIDINLSIPILLYIGISEDKVRDIYFKLISADNYKREYDIRKMIGK